MNIKIEVELRLDGRDCGRKHFTFKVNLFSENDLIDSFNAEVDRVELAFAMPHNRVTFVGKGSKNLLPEEMKDLLLVKAVQDMLRIYVDGICKEPSAIMFHGKR